MDAIYLNDWAAPRWVGAPTSREALLKDFEISEEELAATGEVLLASYSQECYEGSAFVLLRKDGELYEVNGGHCSCNGLEGQWEPELTTVAALRARKDDFASAAAELGRVLEMLEAEKGE